ALPRQGRGRRHGLGRLAPRRAGTRCTSRPLTRVTRMMPARPFVLVADDDQDTRELYRACFDTSGYRTAEAGTGSQAIVSAVEIVPDVLLTDFVLPDIDGVTIARRLKADPRTTGVRIV